jgi:hypothetical protein
MSFLNNVKLYFVKCDPKRPNAFYNKENPTWEVQIRTHDRVQAKEWESQGIPLKVVIPDPEKDDAETVKAGPYWKTVLRKRSKKKDDDGNLTIANGPVEVMDGHLNDIDPNTIGNGSIGNLRIFQYDYPKGEGTGTATVLMGIQVTTHKLYTPTRETFGQTETVRIAEEPKEMKDVLQGDGVPNFDKPTVPSVPSAPAVDPSQVF